MIAFCVSALAALEAFCAPPDVKTLFPAGGQRGQSVEVTIDGKLGSRPVDVWASRPGVTVEAADEGEKVRVTIAEDAPPGVCWLRFHNAEGASGMRPFVVGVLPEVSEQEPNNDYSRPQELPGSSVVVNGRLERAGDVDTFAVQLTAGETLVAVLDAHRTLGSPMDGVLQVVSPRGFVLAQNDDGPGLDPLLEFTAEEDGTYLVRLFAFPADPNSSIRLAGGADYIYRLTLTTGPVVDYLWPLAVPRGSEAAVELVGWNIGEAERTLPLAGGPEAGCVVPLPVSRAATTAVRFVPHAAMAEEASNGPDQPQAIELPATITGRIGAPGEVDVYSFAAKKGEKRLFRCEARALGSPLDPVLELKDAAGKSLRRIDDTSRNSIDCELEFTFEADGEYRLHVSDLFGHGDFRYVYLLSAAAPQPDYTLAAKSDTFQLAAGKPLEIPLDVARIHGFDGEIEIAVEGLPEGVSCAPVKSLPRGATAKAVKLELRADEGTAFQGPFRIVGRVGEESPLRPATAPIGGLSETTVDLWLTVTGGSQR